MAFNNTSIKAAWDKLRSISFAAISNNYIGVGTELLTPVRIVHILNTTDALLCFSWDGIDDNFVLPANGYMVIDLTTNQSMSAGFFLPGRSRLYVKELSVPTTGSVYFSIVYSI